MAAFYADTDSSVHVATAVNGLGHTVTTSHALRSQRAHDAQQLLTAALRGWTLITCNGRDFLLLQRAWTLWPRALYLVPLPSIGGSW